MRVILPYVSQWAETRTALMGTGRFYEPRYVGRSDRAYFDLLASLWAGGRAFCVVEHDIVVNPDTLDSLANCPHDWCAVPYEYMGRKTYGMGCVKFSAALIARNPDAMIRVGTMSDERHPKRHWCRLDAWLNGVVLPQAGEVPHGHEPMVTHLGVGCAHGCTSNA